jgi:DNA-directed RNA polymerase subunit RPC12/RpoP
MSDRVTLVCSRCNARLKAPLAAVGKSAPCPACRHPVFVTPRAPEEAGPMLILDDDDPYGASLARRR